MERFTQVVIQESDSHELKIRKMRINSLGRLFYFIKVALRRKRLDETLHGPWCDSLERDHIKDLYEYPRDHFKTTICSEGLPMWRSLPFTSQDEADFRALSYSDDFIRFMKRMHRQNSRNLLVAENITNAAKLGRRISGHYESTAIFRVLFPDILPDTSCTWSNYSLHHKRTPNSEPHGEGTYDFLGVGGALQSRHYDGLIIQDDLVGRKAVESVSVMEKTIDYHQLVVGAFEVPDEATHENDEFVVGNRWSYNDLNSHIREKEPWFKVVSHGALGGCCKNHPSDTPIFPKEFSFEKLMKLKQRLGTYHFSCQYLNNPAAPENADFHEEDLNYFSIEETTDAGGYKRYINYEVSRDGLVRKRIPFNYLRLGLAVDPNHSGNAGLGRCRHAIVVLGLSPEGNYHLVDCWAKGCGYDEFYNKVFEMAEKWSLRKIGMESIAAQKYIGHHIQQMSLWRGGTPLKILELKGEVEGPDGELTRKKEWRIRNVLAPIFESGRFFTQRRFQDFFGEFSTFPKGRFVDILDAMAYIPGMLKTPQRYEDLVKSVQANQRAARMIRPSYGIRLQ
jgi:hypothetical protein